MGSVGGGQAVQDWDPRPIKTFEGMVTREGESLALMMVRLFAEDTEERLDLIDELFERRDADQLEHHSHKLAGSAANIGAFLMRDALRAIENFSADHAWEGVPFELQRARESWLRLRPRLADYLSTGPESIIHESSDR
jgi:HPt (histidine-containing phosphotransfer) domain-containing protein